MTTVEAYLYSILQFLKDWGAKVFTSSGTLKVTQVYTEGTDTITSSNEYAARTVAAGSKAISIITLPNFSGFINNAEYTGSYTINIVPSLGFVNPEIIITPNAGDYIVNVTT